VFAKSKDLRPPEGLGLKTIVLRLFGLEDLEFHLWLVLVGKCLLALKKLKLCQLIRLPFDIGLERGVLGRIINLCVQLETVEHLLIILEFNVEELLDNLQQL